VAPSPLKRQSPETTGPDAIPLPRLIQQALNCLQAGDTAGALALLATAPAAARDDALACRAFSLIYLSANDYDHAIVWFDHALRLNVKNPDALAGKGTALQGLARSGEAISCFDEALALRADDPETWYNRGVSLDTIGDIEAALQSYDMALAQRPSYARALARRSASLAKLGRFEDALSTANALIAIATDDRADAWCLRGNMLQELGRHGDAIAAYNQTLSFQPSYAAALINRATAHKELGRMDDALSDLDAVLRVAPDHAEALVARGNVLHSLGRNSEALEDYKCALALRPLVTHAAMKTPPEFRAFFIFAPFSGNTPIHDMVSFSNFESHTLMLLPGASYDIDFLRSKADVVVNLVSDVDRSADALCAASKLVERLERPVINPPAKILLTRRDRVSELLADIAGCIVPCTLRYTKETLLASARQQSLGVSFPLIVRVAGTHGGDEMECFAAPTEMEQFAERRQVSEFYVSDFVDYRSADGYFRKYRFIFVGDEILPYHLAIGGKWKVHHASTDMSNHPWMQHEEKVFLDCPEMVFSPRAFEALRAIREKIDLDYFGIDCALDDNGNVVVFEVNASMLVHLHNKVFPYKDPAVRRIKAAFAAMLRHTAENGRAIRASADGRRLA
jgi:tetratricopeptide (TPR) repeat protein/glutathione synthase/RimK-type ligase-like ATP-grasp enzyme